jgi:Na+/H+-dicarboxylate symporter
MMYDFASIFFIAQANGIELDLGTQMTMLLVLMLTSKGIAGVVSLVCLQLLVVYIFDASIGE